MGLNVGYVGAKDAVVLGIKFTTEQQKRFVESREYGELDACVVSVKLGKNAGLSNRRLFRL
jgi:hypothetical protein